MYVCMYSMYMYMYVHVHMYVHVYMYVCMYSTCIMYMYVHVHMYVHVYMYVCMHSCTCMYIHIHVHKYILHVHVHRYLLSSNLSKDQIHKITIFHGNNTITFKSCSDKDIVHLTKITSYIHSSCLYYVLSCLCLQQTRMILYNSDSHLYLLNESVA